MSEDRKKNKGVQYPLIRRCAIDGYYLVDSNTRAVLTPLYSYIKPFYNGYATVRNDKGQWNYLDIHGELVSPNQWFKDAISCMYGYMIVRLDDGQFAVLHQDGTLSDNRIYHYTQLYKGYAIIKRKDNKLNAINSKGELIFKDTWMTSIRYIAPLSLWICQYSDGHTYIYREDGSLLYNEFSLVYVTYLDDKILLIKNTLGKYNLLTKDGKLLSSNKWFKRAYSFGNGLYMVVNDDKLCNLIDNSGQMFFSNTWFKNIRSGLNGEIIITDLPKGGTRIFNKNGKKLLTTSDDIRVSCPYMSDSVLLLKDKYVYEYRYNRRHECLCRNLLKKEVTL